MTHTQFSHALNAKCLRFRFALNKAAQCMNMSNDALQRAIVAARKSQARLQASSERLAQAMEKLA